MLYVPNVEKVLEERHVLWFGRKAVRGRWFRGQASGGHILGVVGWKFIDKEHPVDKAECVEDEGDGVDPVVPCMFEDNAR